MVFLASVARKFTQKVLQKFEQEEEPGHALVRHLHNVDREPLEEAGLSQQRHVDHHGEEQGEGPEVHEAGHVLQRRRVAREGQQQQRGRGAEHGAVHAVEGLGDDAREGEQEDESSRGLDQRTSIHVRQ